MSIDFVLVLTTKVPNYFTKKINTNDTYIFYTIIIK